MHVKIILKITVLKSFPKPNIQFSIPSSRSFNFNNFRKKMRFFSIFKLIYIYPSLVYLTCTYTGDIY